jgi:hypothetical protein
MATVARVFTEEECIKLEGLASYLTLNDIAAYFGMSIDTMDSIRVRQPEVDRAYKKGVADVRRRVGSKLLKYIDDPELNQVNLTATIFYLKTKGGWVDSSKFVEKEINKVRQDLIDIRMIESPKELISKIDRAVSNIDLLLKKECAPS